MALCMFWGYTFWQNASNIKVKTMLSNSYNSTTLTTWLQTWWPNCSFVVYNHTHLMFDGIIWTYTITKNELIPSSVVAKMIIK
jgi:hypothetical protein